MTATTPCTVCGHPVRDGAPADPHAEWFVAEGTGGTFLAETAAGVLVRFASAPCAPSRAPWETDCGHCGAQYVTTLIPIDYIERAP